MSQDIVNLEKKIEAAATAKDWDTVSSLNLELKRLKALEEKNAQWREANKERLEALSKDIRTAKAPESLLIALEAAFKGFGFSQVVKGQKAPTKAGKTVTKPGRILGAIDGNKWELVDGKAVKVRDGLGQGRPPKAFPSVEAFIAEAMAA